MLKDTFSQGETQLLYDSSEIGLSLLLFEFYFYNIEPEHDKTYNNTCVTNKDSDQPVNPSSMARLLVYPSFDSLEAEEGTCAQR